MIGSAGARRAESIVPEAEAPSGRRWADLMTRAASGLVMVAVALLTAWWGGDAFKAFWLLAACAVLWEWQGLPGTARRSSRFAVGAVGLAAAAWLMRSGQVTLALTVLAVAALGAATVAGPWARIAAAAGVAYAGALLLAVSLLRGSVPDGMTALLWLFAVVWGTDVMAYFGGRSLGGPKLWPRLSPGKTWSGFLVGVACGALAGLLVKPAPSPALPCLAVGLLAAAVAQGGDLFESGLKRRYGVKDASHLIPGHGGVMDRLDGFIAAAVFAACLGSARAGLGAAGAGLFGW